MLDLEPWRVRRLVAAGLLHPARGSRREYLFSFVDLVVLRTARELLKSGVPFRRVRAALNSLHEQLPEDRSLTEMRIRAEGERVIVQEDTATWDAESRQVLFDFGLYELAEAVLPLLARTQVPGPADAEEPLSAAEWFDLACDLEPESAEEARAAYRRAIEVDAGHVDARVNLGRLDHEAGDIAAAEEHYRLALESRPADLTARFNLGVALEDMGRLPEARNAYRETVLADPSHADAHFNLAGVLERLGQKHQAIKHLKQYRNLVNAGADDSAR